MKKWSWNKEYGVKHSNSDHTEHHSDYHNIDDEFVIYCIMCSKLILMKLSFSHSHHSAQHTFDGHFKSIDSKQFLISIFLFIISNYFLGHNWSDNESDFGSQSAHSLKRAYLIHIKPQNFVYSYDTHH